MYYVVLKNRGVVRVSGPERRDFLQGLISNDIHLLDRQPCVYACLLSPQGKYLHDFFITEREESLILECEGGERAEDLFKKLSLYKLRANVALSVEPDIEVYAILPPLSSSRRRPGSGASEQPDPGLRRDDVLEDPRHPEIGYRSFMKPEGMEEQPFDVWDRRRIELAIPDGSRDMIVGQSTLIECNIDRLNGIAWEKGCYMGQELTARMHYRGLVKKRLQTVYADSNQVYSLRKQGSFNPDEDPRFRGEGTIIEIRSTCGDVGLALVKVD